MEIKIINFDAYFEKYMNEWLLQENNKNKNMDQLESEIEDVYLRWLNLPAKWLDGETPGVYFSKFRAEMLVKALARYINAGVPVPDLLLDAIAACGKEAEEPLLKLQSGQAGVPVQNNAASEMKATAIRLLNEVQSTVSMEEYLRELVDNPQSECAEIMVEALTNMGERVLPQLLQALDSVTHPESLSWLLTVAVGFPGNEQIFRHLLNAYIENEQDRELFAAFLGDYGDERAIPILKEMMKSGKLNYLQWVESRNAVEALGGTVEGPEPEFSGDPYYESIKDME